jgi:hypothetical protein
VPIEIGIVFDQYPDENGWMLIAGGGDEYDPEEEEDPEKTNRNVVWESKYYDPLEYASRADTFVECVPPGNYTLVFTDAEGDGLCCYHGEGRYVLSSAGVIIAVGGTTDAEEEAIAFALPYAEPDPIDEDGDGRDDRLGWLLPYGSPPPNAALTEGIDCENFRLVILTDGYGVETTWELYEGRDAASGVLVADGGPYGSDYTYVVDTCLRSPGEYALYVYDWDGRGLCCESGEGYFGIKSGDIVIAENDGRFGEVNVTRFVLPADGSVSFDDFRSLSPTVATSTPSAAPISSPPTNYTLPPEFEELFTASPTTSSSPTRSPTRSPTPRPTLAPARPDELDTVDQDKETSPFPTFSPPV